MLSGFINLLILFYSESNTAATEQRWRIDVADKIRDAEITLKQADKFSSDSDRGIVPLLNFYGEYHLLDRWNFIINFDGLASPRRRALDLGLVARYDVSRQWFVGGSYRMLEGGADNSEVYNFSWFIIYCYLRDTVSDC